MFTSLKNIIYYGAVVNLCENHYEYSDTSKIWEFLT
jgi:hypothetical protein